MPTRRTVVYCDLFEADLDAIKQDVPRIEEFVEGAEIILSRSPHVGFQINDVIWYLPGFTVDAALYYTFDDERVFFISIQRVRVEEEQ
jgi:hypothetical protein